MTAHTATVGLTARPSTSSEPHAAKTWSDVAVDQLKALWADPDLSAAAIARRLGVSRNAVLGKVHRLGLSNRRPATTSRAPRTPRPPRPARRPAGRVRPATAARPAAAMGPPPDEDPGRARRLEEIPHQGCHWPIGDPRTADFTFCGRAARVAPYCDAHRSVAYRPGGAQPAERFLRRGRA